jgi:BolA protein
MTNRSDRMEKLLVEAFAPTTLSIRDDSAKHAGHAGAAPGGETHYALYIVSDAFAGKSQVARHRMVYDVLAPLFAEGLHALQIEARVVGE